MVEKAGTLQTPASEHSCVSSVSQLHSWVTIHSTQQVFMVAVVQMMVFLGFHTM
jgi:hypothetical protein